MVLHRHFPRDDRIELGVAATILLKWRKEERTANWHTLRKRATKSVFWPYVQDMRNLIDLLD